MIFEDPEYYHIKTLANLIETHRMKNITERNYSKIKIDINLYLYFVIGRL